MLFPRRLSKRGAEFIARFEGFVATPYNDAAGNATIGYGHLIHKGPVTPADRARWGTLSRERALALLEQDAQVAADAVLRHVRPRLASQARFDALVSFVFNIGEGQFASSTVLRCLNSGIRRRGAADALLAWDHAGGRVLEGLHERRTAERHLFLTGSYG